MTTRDRSRSPRISRPESTEDTPRDLLRYRHGTTVDVGEQWIWHTDFAEPVPQRS